jgi:hypothetical protein
VSQQAQTASAGGTVCAVALFALAVAAAAANAQSIPLPDPNASRTCTADESSIALRATGEGGPVMACFVVARYVFQGSALVLEANDLPEHYTVSAGFQPIRRQVMRVQSARLRSDRDLSDAMPGEPPAHGTLPRSLAVTKVTPLGVFAEGSAFIGYADLVPWSSGGTDYPLLSLHSYVLRGNSVFKLVVTSLVSGPETVARGYGLAEDWAKAVAEQR